MVSGCPLEAHSLEFCEAKLPIKITVSITRERERERERERANTVPSGAFTQRFLRMFGLAGIFAILCYILHKFGKKSRGAQQRHPRQGVLNDHVTHARRPENAAAVNNASPALAGRARRGTQQRLGILKFRITTKNTKGRENRVRALFSFSSFSCFSGGR
jgi:hypothetical protein